MREYKNIEEILNEKGENHLKFLLSKSSIFVESIDTYNNQHYILDLLIVQMIGYLEKKYQDYNFFIAVSSPNNRYFYYNKSHEIGFKFNDLYKLYKELFNIDDKSNVVKDFVEFIKPLNNASDEKKYLSLMEVIKQIFESFTSYCNFQWLFLQAGNNNIFDSDNNEIIYNKLKELFDSAYQYRHSIAHNIISEYKNDTVDFSLLKNENIYSNKIFYLYIIILADSIINKLYKEYKRINMSDF